MRSPATVPTPEPHDAAVEFIMDEQAPPSAPELELLRSVLPDILGELRDALEHVAKD